jgi:hypothetical protein
MHPRRRAVRVMVMAVMVKSQHVAFSKVWQAPGVRQWCGGAPPGIFSICQIRIIDYSTTVAQMRASDMHSRVLRDRTCQ